MFDATCNYWRFLPVAAYADAYASVLVALAEGLAKVADVESRALARLRKRENRRQNNIVTSSVGAG
jgi:hypothetical protein